MAATLDLDAISRRKDIVVCATATQLEVIRSLLPQLCVDKYRITKMDHGVHRLSLDTILTKVPQLLLPDNITMNDLSEKGVKKEEEISDFEQSEEFYAKAKPKDSYKIISDEFSSERNVKLYVGLNAVESAWREVVVKSSDPQKIKLADGPRNYRSKGYDHKISHYSLSELFEEYLFSPASDTYIKTCWEKQDVKLWFSATPCLELM